MAKKQPEQPKKAPHWESEDAIRAHDEWIKKNNEDMEYMRKGMDMYFAHRPPGGWPEPELEIHDH